jgi:hypothetical protein
MLYLKLFKESFDASDYYQEISPTDESRMKKVFDSFEERYITELIELFNQELPPGHEYRMEDVIRLVTSGKNKDVVYLKFILDMSRHIIIGQLVDEWFMVSIYNNDKKNIQGFPERIVYKCDQFEGLVKLLQDKDII